jgi:hypothetical protein
MAGLNRRFALAAVLLPFFFVAISGVARASGIVTNCTTFGPGAGTLDTALMAAAQ